MIRFSSADDLVILKEEANLCAISCLRILKAVCNSNGKLPLLLDCLHSTETCLSVLDKALVLEQEEKQKFDQSRKVVVESFEVVKKWLKKTLLSKIPCYIMDGTQKELEVQVYCKQVIPCA